MNSHNIEDVPLKMTVLWQGEHKPVTFASYAYEHTKTNGISVVGSNCETDINIRFYDVAFALDGFIVGKQFNLIHDLEKYHYMRPNVCFMDWKKRVNSLGTINRLVYYEPCINVVVYKKIEQDWFIDSCSFKSFKEVEHFKGEYNLMNTHVCVRRYISLRNTYIGTINTGFEVDNLRDLLYDAYLNNSKWAEYVDGVVRIYDSSILGYWEISNSFENIENFKLEMTKERFIRHSTVQ